MEMLAMLLMILKFAPLAFVGVGIGWTVIKGLLNGDQTVNDLLRHTYTIGETGTGKSTKCLNDIINVVNKGYGLLYIDVHGKDSRELLDCIPPKHADRVIYIDPSNTESAIGFSISDGNDEQLAVDALLSVFDTIWPGFIGPSTEDLLRQAALAIIPNKGTLLDLYQMLVDDEYREKIQIKDYMVNHFWKVTFPATVKKDKGRLNPPTNKLRKLIMTRICRLTLCQERPKFDLMQAMRDGSIVICNFSKGKLGHDTSSLLAALMFSKLWLNTFQRDENSVPFFCFLDEFQNYVTQNFTEILSEARKYSISLNLYHQYMRQVPEYLHHAIRGNVGSRYAFRGDDDKKMVADMLGILPEDVEHLPNYHCYCKRLIRGVREEEAQLLKCPPPPEKFNLSRQIINRSKRYGYCPEQVLMEVESRMKMPDTLEDEI